MPAKRMNREDFFAKLAPLDEDRLRKVLWNLYWRGSSAMRERIEDELDPAEQQRRSRLRQHPADPDLVLYEVREFAGLARAGAYIAGDRRVSPKERTRWRVTFRQLGTNAQSALRADDTGAAEEALALIIDLACEMKDCQYFRSEDPVEAARFVVSDAAELLWQTVRDRHGFGCLRAAGCTAIAALGVAVRVGPPVAGTRSTRRRLPWPACSPGCWACPIRGSPFPPATWPPWTRRHAPRRPRRPRHGSMGSWGYGDAGYRRRERASNLAEWHGLLLDRLADSEAEDRLDRLVSHPALDGTERTFLQARLARQRGDSDAARKLISDCLGHLPGHQDFASFAAEVGAG